MRASHHPKAEPADRASAVGHHHRGGIELGDDGSEAAKAADTIRRARSVSEIRFENVHVVRGVQIVQSRRRFVTVSHAMEAMGRRRIGLRAWSGIPAGWSPDVWLSLSGFQSRVGDVVAGLGGRLDLEGLATPCPSGRFGSDCRAECPASPP
jgi:hypothetical protein